MLIQLKSFLAIFFILICFCNSYAQKGGLPLADEYYKQNEYEKAASIYINFTDNLENSKKIFSNYVNCLKELKKYAELEKFYKKIIKWEPGNIFVRTDLALFYFSQNDKSNGQKIIDKLILNTRQNLDYVIPTADYFLKNGLIIEAKAIYVAARKNLKSEQYFTLEMAQIHKSLNETDEMINELVRTLVMNQADKEFLKSKFQDFIVTDTEFEKFETNVFARIQSDPTQTLYNELLIWIYTQQKKFDRAFIQAKALDRLLKTQGSKLLELGKIAYENKDYEACIEIFEYLTSEYSNSPYYAQASKLKIQAKEELIKSKYPIAREQIYALINDYKQISSNLPKSKEVLEMNRNMALLYGFYLNSIDTAIILLDNIIKSPWADIQILAKSKLDLGDMYILKNEPWESTLLYSQVEKLQKDQPLGNEAKLKNAKLSYFTGQFEFAKEHLDVLKLATHREIANDAIDLSLFIQDHTTAEQDSNFTNLKEYANIELLIFQNKFYEALTKSEILAKNAKGSSLEEEIYFLQSKIYLRINEIDKSIEKLSALSDKFKYGIYGDDAAFMLANITEEKLRNKEKAIELYNNFLVNYKASIFIAEARKRLRQLRGDNL